MYPLFCLPLFVFNSVNILQNVQHMNRSARHTTLLIEDDMEFPGFTTLKLIAEGDEFTSPEYCDWILGLCLYVLYCISCHL
jgi:hypothetical protein